MLSNAHELLLFSSFSVLFSTFYVNNSLGAFAAFAAPQNEKVPSHLILSF